MASSELGTVLVAGGSSPIGEAIVHAVKAAHGIPVVIDQVAPSYPVDHELADCTDMTSSSRAVKRLAGRYGGLSGLVLTDVPDTTVEPARPGITAVIRAATPYLEEVGGTIVTLVRSPGVTGIRPGLADVAEGLGVTLLVPEELNRPDEIAHRVVRSLAQPREPGGDDLAVSPGQDDH